MLRRGLRRFYRGVRPCALSGKRALFYRREDKDKDNAEAHGTLRFRREGEFREGPYFPPELWV
jgi:hypothetical protein